MEGIGRREPARAGCMCGWVYVSKGAGAVAGRTQAGQGRGISGCGYWEA